MKNLRWMRAAMWVCLAVATLGFVATFLLESGYSAQAQAVQPIRRDSNSDTGWSLDGPAIEVINVPEKAFVTRGADGIPAQVDSAVLAQSTDVIPMQPIRGTIHAARLGSMAAALIMAVGMVILSRFTLTRHE